MEVLTIRDLEKCMFKHQSEDKKSTTFMDVNKGHQLYDCYSCLGFTNVCGSYKPLKEYSDSKFFYRVVENILKNKVK